MENNQKPSSDSLYLDQLQFEQAKANKLLHFLLTNGRVIFLSIMVIMAWGFFAFNQLPLESTPEVKIPFGIVTVALPGASPGDVEELVVKKIEAKVSGLSGVKTVNSSALNSFAAISVEFQAQEDIKDAIRRLRDAVESAKSSLPAEALDPVVSEISFSNTPIWTLVLTGPQDSFTLRHYAEMVEHELAKLPGAEEVKVSGGDIAEISISYNPQKLEQYGLSIDMVNNIIRANNLTLPLGELETGNFTYGLRLDGKFKNITELRNLPISSSGDALVRLSDVGDIVERAATRSSIARFSSQGRPAQSAISINVVKKTGASIIQLVDDGKAKIAELKASHLPADVLIETTYDESEIIREDFDNLSHEGFNTVLLVTVILFLFVGLKEAFTAGIVIPLVFASTFGLMLLAGQTINFLSLFSLILSLGLLVDDAIVVVQATKQYMATGKFTPEEAVLLVFKDFFAIILTTSLTTIFAFLPLLLATGIIGQFIRSIPITVSLTLAASTIIAICINHPLAAILERFRFTRTTFRILAALFFLAFLATLPGALQGQVLGLIAAALLLLLNISLLLFYRRSWRKTLLANEEILLQEEANPAHIKAKLQHHYSEDIPKSFWVRATSGLVKMDRLMPSYERLLHWFLDSKIRAFGLILTVILVFGAAVALPATGILKSEFLPPADKDLMFVNIEGAPGLVLEETAKVADQVEKILLGEKQIKHFSLVIGETGVDFSGGGASGGGSSTSGQSNRAQFAINLWPEKERPVKQKSYEYAPELRAKLASVSGAKVTLQEVSGGPPSGADFEVTLAGENLQKLEQLANQYKDYLAAIPGTINEKTSLTLSPGEFTFKLKPVEMQLRGITPAQIAGSLRTAISGAEIAKILDGEEEISIRTAYQDGAVDSLEALQSLTVQNMRGQRFALAEVADVQIGSSLTAIRRENEKRVVTLSASVEAPALPGEVLAAFQKILAEKPLPAGYEAIFGGQNDTNAESVFSILRAMIVAFLLIISVLVIQFNSFRKALLVLLTIPLAMTGVFFGLTAIGFTLSFPTLIGLLALFGIVVKNAIILIDKINLNLRVGIAFREAIIDASKSRLEAIFLTTASTIIGMIPITLYDETWEGLGAALIFGLSSSTVLTLLLIPIVFHLLFAGSARRAERVRQLRSAN